MSPPNVSKEPLDGGTKNLDHAVVCQGGLAGFCVLLVRLHLYSCFETSCSAIDCFDYSYAPAALAAVAGGCAVLLDSLDKVFEHGLVSANLADSGGGSALVLAPGGMIDKTRLTVAEVGRNDAIVFENNCAQRSGNFQPSRITGIRSRVRFKSVDAPIANSRTATAVSSVSMACSIVAVRAWTRAMSPSSHSSRSTVCTPLVH